MQLFYELGPADLSAAQRLFYLRRRAGTFCMVEHLPTENDYDLAAAFVRAVADELGVTL